MNGALEDLLEKMFQEIRVLDERISAEEIDVLEMKRGCRDTVVVGGEVAQMAAAGSRSSKAEGDLLVSEVGLLQRDSEEDW